MTTFNLTCQAVEATLPDYLDETLEPWLRTSIEDHLAGCERCTGLVRELRTLTREAAALPPVPPQEDPWPRIALRIGAPLSDSESLTDLPIADAPPSPPASDAFPPTSRTASAAPTSADLSDAQSLDHAVTPSGIDPFVHAGAPRGLPTADERTTEESTTHVPALEREVAVPIHKSFIEPGVAPPTPVNEPVSLEREVPIPTSEWPVSVPLPGPVPATTPASERATVAPAKSRRQKVLSVPSLGLAAAALVLVTAGTTFVLTVQWLSGARIPNVASNTETGKVSSTAKARPRTATRAAVEKPSHSAPHEIASTMPTADQPSSPALEAPTTTVTAPPSTPVLEATSPAPVPHSAEDAVYDKEIVGLQRIVRRQRGELDASTVAEIEKNLRALDAAIEEINVALKRDPGNVMLEEQGSRALEMKVELLRRAAMMHAST